MKKLLLALIVFIPLFSASQTDVFISLNSNIEYAPIGAGVIIGKKESKINYFLNMKMSEDYFNREMESENVYLYDPSKVFDVNEFFMTAGIFYKINSAFEWYLGAGFFNGEAVQPASNNFDKWIVVDKDVKYSPVLSFGIANNINKIKLSLGYEAAFVDPESYPSFVLNQNSFIRLSSLSLGFAFKF